MKRRGYSTAQAAVLVACALAGPAGAHEHGAPATVAAWAQGAQLFSGLGDFHRPATTPSAQAQAYFDQGLRLMYAFNHDEATRSFAKAAELDPRCAACYWGVALTVGPNYNFTEVDAVRVRVAFDALAQARAHEDQASAVERGLIEALAVRHPAAQAPDHAQGQELLKAYAAAMQALAAQFPGDDDVQVLTAEAQMTVHAWKLWTPDGQPVADTAAIEERLERVLARNPHHPGANHYYVHVMEESPTPGKALAAASALTGMMPAAGHLEHMPAHIMQRVGRYEDAAEANRRGAAADRAYLAQTDAPDYYPMYYAHNEEFLAYSASMEGRKAESLAAVAELASILPASMQIAMGESGWHLTPQYGVLVRFGLWDELIALLPPDERLRGARVGYYWSRGVALAARGDLDGAAAMLAALKAQARDAGDQRAGENSLAAVIEVAVPVLEARIAATLRKDTQAVERLRAALAAEDRLGYDEPPDWFVPVRHLLGAQLLIAGQPREAEAVYLEDLRRNPDNGWALAGLARALAAQGRHVQARQRATEQARAWQHADVQLPGSAFWYAGADLARCECEHRP
ncbi:MAG: hypothetical protein JSS29_02365 [Proteobacteria bacterium]|nr:hypothetical protein [Pseudomonadota bacterium]